MHSQAELKLIIQIYNNIDCLEHYLDNLHETIAGRMQWLKITLCQVLMTSPRPNVHKSYCFDSINQSILFLIKCYIINALSAVQWNTHISLNTRIYIYSEIQHTYKHSYKAAMSAQIQYFLFQAHTLSHSWTLQAARALLILGNPSLVLKSPPGVPPSMLQPRQHHSRPTLIQPLVTLLSLSR